MGIELAALGTLGAAAGTGAAAAGAGVAGLTAAEAAAAGLTAATAAESAGAVAAGAAAAEGAGVAAGSLEAANLVGALGGDSLGAFISANQGFGTMSAMESMQGMLASVQSSPIVQGIEKAAGAGKREGDTQVKVANAPQASQVTRPNQNPGLTQQSGLMQAQDRNTASSLTPLGFADGGQVPALDALKALFPDNIFDRTRTAREEQAGAAPNSGGNVTINIGRSGDEKQQGSVPRSEAQTPSMSQLVESIGKLITGGYADGGSVRSGASDVRAGGEIRGPESKTGKDNQVIAVAGGEGILPKDVMDVPGVADLVQSLIKTYHTPVR